ncbi:hypothetical protein NliqN6_3351 [Naganishia liquefaciens]|uniref:Uncharacterized protein n=1 Tax=Naganishia liquefaciens TaxID=104408 RepID=A0A8H3YEX0_9TREE|nr:hypothetical protein NliqN6_3351 [Naganishia liquefaciens]
MKSLDSTQLSAHSGQLKLLDKTCGQDALRGDAHAAQKLRKWSRPFHAEDDLEKQFENFRKLFGEAPSRLPPPGLQLGLQRTHCLQSDPRSGLPSSLSLSPSLSQVH